MDALDFLTQSSSGPTYSADVTVRPSGGGAASPLSQDELLKKLKAKGYSDAGAEGIVRNIMRESGGDPTVPGDDGTSAGLFQHHASRLDELKAYASDKNKSWTDPDIQIDFAENELKTKFPKLQAQLTSTDDPGEAYKAFKDIFERPKGTGTSYGNVSYSPYAMSEYEGQKGTDLVHMRPSDYLDLSPELEDPWKDASGKSLKKSLARGDQIEQIPSMTVKPSGDGSAEVTDQDGRHRALAAQEAGADLIPVAVQGRGNAPLTEIQGMRGNVLPYDFQPVKPPPQAQVAAPSAPPAPAQAPQNPIMAAIMPRAEAAELPAIQSPQAPDKSVAEAAKAQTSQAQTALSQAHLAGRQASAEPQKQTAEDFLKGGSDAGPKEEPNMTPLQSFGSGLKDVAVGAANLVNNIPGPLDWVPGMQPRGAQQYQQQLNQANQARNAEIGILGGDNAYRMGGQIVGQAGLGMAAGPAMGALGVGARAMPAAVGALSGATQPTRSDKLSEVAWNTVLGAAGGAAAGGITNALKRAIAPALGPMQRLLADAGVRLTPGQMAGGLVQRIENKLSSIPVLGDAISSAERRGVEDFNQAAVNRALSPLGEKLPPDVTGRDAIAFAKAKFNEAYNDVLPKMVGQMDPGLQHDLTQIATLGQGLPPAGRDELLGVLKNSVVSKFSKGGGISGESAQKVGMELGDMAKTMGRSESPYTRQLGMAVRETKAAMDRMMARTNPTLAPIKSKIDEGYANYKIVERAAKSAGTDAGLFTPAQLSNAVMGKDVSKDKAAFARGGALMQDLSDAAKGVLPSKVPNSGTADRYLMATGTLGAGAYFTPHGALGLLAAAAPYTKAGIGAMNAMAQPAGPARNALANVVGQSGRYLAPGAGVAATNALAGGGQ